jgi:hypothetical protein
MSGENCFRFPDTGQVRCYDRDGNEIQPAPGDPLWGQNGCSVTNPPAFKKLDERGGVLEDSAGWVDGFRTVLDDNTGLVWEVKSPDPADVNAADALFTWEEARTVHVAELNRKRYGGFDDWRMPNKDELRSVFDYGRTSPALDPWYFPSCRIGMFWCDATYEMQPYLAWAIFSGLGAATAQAKAARRYAMAVRGGWSKLFGKMDARRFVDNRDGTVTDLATGLMWQRAENPRSNWYESLEGCRNLRLAGFADWRLPNIKEINSILNLAYTGNSWFFKDVFPGEGLVPPFLHYFSSTVHERTFAWVTNFNFGYDGYYAGRDAKLLYRAVRNIEPPKPKPEVFVLPATGQTACYDVEGVRIDAPNKGEPLFGQDAQHQQPRGFVRLRDRGLPLPASAGWDQGWRMVIDGSTGLVWEIKSPEAGALNYRLDRYSWSGAREFVDGLNRANYGGYSDWRLPNREELRTIAVYSDAIPAVDPAFFPDARPEFYWSKDSYHADQKMAWGVYFAYGCAICYHKDIPYPVRAVRGGYNPAFGDAERYSFSDNRDGTVTDHVTRLMWKKDEVSPMTLAEALSYCENLDTGHRDWRLANIRELGTLVDLSYNDGKWFHPDFFPDTVTKPQGFYLSSSAFGATFAWGVNFQFGYDGYYGDRKLGKYPFRPVRLIGMGADHDPSNV